ncbi:hypothetical protein BD410DRAFT_826755 [Rickenella mellea]|uniref:DUF7918 domain-containing protein n=1 Tax=Rickenella mellea TaxID=50990 RepID=A0A4Y7QBX3_9AGAM|nr:hypothetical protein BD410DRAFT_826755 [Rickenella mellea]
MLVLGRDSGIKKLLEASVKQVNRDCDRDVDHGLLAVQDVENRFVRPEQHGTSDMPTHRQFQCWIQCGDEVLTEHSVAVDDKTNVVSCWIPSEVGKVFTINYRYIKGVIPFRYIVYVDGVRARGTVVFNEHPCFREGMCDGARVDSKTIRPFIFSSINMTDDESIATVIPKSSFGTIEIKFELVVSAGTALWPDQKLEFDDGPLHENKRKIGTHRVTLGSARERPVTQKRLTKPYDPLNPGPQATFRFLYRSREFLMAQGVIEKRPMLYFRRTTGSGGIPYAFSTCKSSPSKSASSSPQMLKRKTNDFSIVSEEVLEREISTRKKLLSRLRRERELEEEIGMLEEKKQEITSKRIKKNPIKTEDGVIDLTGD